MSVPYEINNKHPFVSLPDNEGDLNRMKDEKHNALLSYLKDKLACDRFNVNARRDRYARIDKTISTWMKLTDEESIRDRNEEINGRAAVTPFNMPILITHLEDSVAFFTEIFAPQLRNFYSVAPKNESQAASALSSKLNRDTKSRKYYKQIAVAMRACLKYNLGGVMVRWDNSQGVGQLSQPGNRIEGLDMYNAYWDPSVLEPSRIHMDAEWFAQATAKNRMWLVRNAKRGILQRVSKVLSDYDVLQNQKGNYGQNLRGDNESIYYINPPVSAGLGLDGQTKTDSVNWESFGAALPGEVSNPITGHEVIEMYCRLNPAEWGLDTSQGNKSQADPYQLWRFIIVDARQICLAERVEVKAKQSDADIPVYLSYMIQDDTKAAQRSTMELMKPFQRLISFLVNVYIYAARKNIWGLKIYDSSAVNISDANRGDVAGWISSKLNGRDVRTAIATVNEGATGTEQVFEIVNIVQAYMNQLFPAQALPAQVAGIDRAVTNQVTAVMQGVARRMHMSAQLIDSDMFGAMRMECYRNLVQYDADGLTDLTEEAVAEILGSGLMQMNADTILAQINQLLMALIQNPESAAGYDMPGLYNYMSQMMNSPFNLGDFVKQVNPAVPAPEQPLPGAEGSIPEEAVMSGIMQ